MQYGLSCAAGSFNTPTNGKKLAWGTTAYVGTSLTSVHNGQRSYPFDGFPASGKIAYSPCLVFGEFPAKSSLTAVAAANPTAASCASAIVP